MTWFEFESVNVLYVSCSCNSVAHELARFSMGEDSDQFVIWIDPLPVFVTEILRRDLMPLRLDEQSRRTHI